MTEDSVCVEYSDYEYIGWVPCLTGQLSYGLCKDNLGEEGTVHKSILKICPEKRSCHQYKIAMKSIVDWQDLKKDQEGRWHVVFVASTVKETDLAGSIYIYPASNSLHSSIQDGFHSLIKHGGDDETEHWQSTFNKLDADLDEIDNEEWYQVHFHLKSNGLAFFKIKKGTSSNSLEGNRVLCRQSFYYLKYAFHEHKHHPKDNDSLTTIHPLNVDKHEIAESLLFDLKQSLIEVKRKKQVMWTDRKLNFVGITSYMKSLVQACHACNFIDDKHYESELKLIDNTEKSYESKQAHSNLYFNNKNLARGEGRQVISLIFIVLAPWALMIDKSAVNTDSFITRTLSTIYTNDILSLFFLLAIICIYNITVISTRKYHPLLTFFSSKYKIIKLATQYESKARIVTIVSFIIALSIIGYALKQFINSVVG